MTEFKVILKGITFNMFNTLININFRKMILGQAVSRFGDSMTTIAGMWLIWDMTKSAKILGLFSFCLGAIALVGFFSGVIIDRYPKKKIMIISDLLRFVLILTLAILIYLDYFSWQLFLLLMCLSSLVGLFFTPSQRTLLPQVVSNEELPQANGLLFVVEQVGLVGGALITGAILIPLSPSLAFFINSLTFILSFVFIYSLKVNEENKTYLPKGKGKFKEEFFEVWKYIYSTPILLLTTPLVSMLFFSFAPFLILLSQWSDEVLKKGAFGYSMLEIFYPLGMLLGGILTSRILARTELKIAFILGLSCGSASIILFSFTNNFILSLIFILLVGFFISVSNISLVSVQQVIVPLEMRGRYLSTSQSINNIVLPVGYLLWGIVSDTFGIIYTFLASGILFTLCSSIFLIIGIRKKLFNEVYFKNKNNPKHIELLQSEGEG